MTETETELDRAIKTISRYCYGNLDCSRKGCKAYWWCINIQRQFSPAYVYAFRKYKTIDDIISKLKSSGWKKLEIKNKDIAVYQNLQNGITVQITVPLSKELSDYDFAFNNAVGKLVDFETMAERLKELGVKNND